MAESQSAGDQINKVKPDTTPTQPTAIVKKVRGPSLVWLIPIFTLLVGGWLVSKYLADRGPAITITFKTADGIEKKTPIKYKDVVVGEVKKIRFTENFKKIELTARMSANAENFLRQETRFWVVRPHLSLHGASGLSTLLSGTYIEVDPGKGFQRYKFKGLEEAPALTSDANGLRITLTAEKLGSLDIGAPVYFKGLTAGKILDYDLAGDQQSVIIHAFIKQPFDKLIHNNSHFWHVGGIDATVNGSGLQLHSPSLLTMVFGGIAFDSPATDEKKLSGEAFPLHSRYDDIMATTNTKKLSLVSYFNQSVHGLDNGAAVEFQGITIGKVKQIDLAMNQNRQGLLIPVTLEIDADRLPAMTSPGTQPMQFLQQMIDRGLRSQLKTSSLLTGKLYVSLAMHPEDNKPRLMADAGSTMTEIPSIAGGLDQLQASLQHILTGIEKVDSEQIGRELQGSLLAFRRTLTTLNNHAGPVADNLEKTLKQARLTLKSLDSVLDASSPAQFRLTQAGRDLADMARSIRAFVDMLDRHPNALLFGNSSTGDRP